MSHRALHTPTRAIPGSLSLVACLVVFLVASCVDLRAQAPAFEFATSIGHFNADQYRDTMYCQELSRGVFLPTRLAWGTSSGDTTRDRSTRFQFPNWRGLRGSVACVKVNADTLLDIVLFLKGLDTTAHRDTLRRFVIFGQERIHRREQITINQVSRAQTAPFFAIDLDEGTHLVEPRVRDVSRVRSFRLRFPAVDVGDTTNELSPLPLAGVDAADGIQWVRIYPNPAMYSTTLDAALASPGSCSATLVASNGSTVLRRVIDVGADGRILERLDLTAVASGFYELQLSQNGAAARSFPVIVVR